MIKIKPIRRARPPAPSERHLHMAVAAYLRVALAAPTYWSSVDHGAGKLSKAAAGNAKGRGCKAGLPDVFIFHPCTMTGASIVVGLELKSRLGRLSSEQVETHAALERAGVSCCIARSVDEVEQILASHGVPLRARSLGLGRVA